MADDLVFYTNPMSRGAIVRWMLEEVGAPYETVLLDYATTMKAEPYLSVNPMGKVPAITHNGQVVTEGAAICTYLAESFPDADLGPTYGTRGAFLRWMFFAAGPVEQAVTNRAAGFAPTPEQGRMFGYGSFDKTMDVLEGAVAGKAYVVGDRFSAVDVYLGSQIGWGLAFGTIDKRAEFERYWVGLKDRPAKQRADAIDAALREPPPA